MDQPTLTDYAHLIITLFDKFVQTNPVVLKYQKLCTYQCREMILFFMIMQFRRTYEFKAQKRWFVITSYSIHYTKLYEYWRLRRGEMI